MKKTPLWDDKQESTCGFCQHATLLMADCEQVICNKKKNVFHFSHSCKKFKFDILKKDVRRQKLPDFNRFRKEQFEL